MRLFLAIELPDDVRDHLVGLQRRWSSFYTQQWGGSGRDFSLTKPENLHVTLKFLGDVSDAELGALVPRLQQLQPVGPIALRTTGVAYFPPRGPIRVIVADVEGDMERLGLVYEQVESLCHAQGFTREGRAFHPHITVARARQGIPGRLRSAEGFGTSEPGPEFVGKHITLFESRLKPTGPEYVPLATFAV